MRRFVLHVLMFACLLLSACSREQGPPADTKATASHHVGGAVSDETPAPPRVYAPMPARLLAAPEAGSPTVWSEWAWVQVHIAHGSLDEAMQTHSRIKAQTPQEHRVRALAAMQLAHSLINVTPPDLQRVRPLLDDLHANMDAWRQDARMVEDYEGLTMLRDLADGSASLEMDQDRFQAWLSRLIQRAGTPWRTNADERALLHALDHMLSSAVSAPSSTVDRLEFMLTALQIEAAWASPDLLRALQERRVQLLADAKRHKDALFEGRILLGLASQDAHAWTNALARMPELMRAAGLADDMTVRFQQHQLHAPAVNGANQDANATDPLAHVIKETSMPWDYLAQLSRSSPPSHAHAAEAFIRSGIIGLLTGKGAEAMEHLAQLATSDHDVSSREVEVVLAYAAMAQSLSDGHALHCERGPARISDRLASSASASATSAPLWHYQAAQFLNGREALVRTLIDHGHSAPALELCRVMADGSRDHRRVRERVQLTWQACEAAAKNGQAETPIAHFLAWGKRLCTPLARICHARMAAERLNSTGDEAAVLPVIESVRDIWTEASQDHEFMLLRLSCMVRVGQSAQALSEIKTYCERGDLSPECSWRGQLLLGVAYLQEGRPASARTALRRLLDENPPRQYRDRAITVLRNIKM